MTDWATEIAKPFVDYDHFLTEDAAKRWQESIATALRKAKADGIAEMALWVANGHQEYADNYIALAAASKLQNPTE